MSNDYIWHVTLDTGHARQSYRSEIDDAIATLVRQHIDEALAGHPVEIRPGYDLKVSTAGGALLATVISNRVGPLVTIAIARVSRHSRKLWDLMDGQDSPPETPWCAVRLHPGLDDDLAAASWLGDFERCIAWAWIS